MGGCLSTETKGRDTMRYRPFLPAAIGIVIFQFFDRPLDIAFEFAFGLEPVRNPDVSFNNLTFLVCWALLVVMLVALHCTDKICAVLRERYLASDSRK